ncbi:MAG: hypothetical protein QXS85_03255 [Acidilobaceae archaeon]
MDTRASRDSSARKRGDSWRKDPLVSSWVSVFEELSRVGEPVLEVSSAPLLFNLLDLRSLELREASSFTWVWRGFRVDVNGGGLIASGSLAQPRGFATELKSIDSASLGSMVSSLLEPEVEGVFFFNPLGWRPRAPIMHPRESLGLGLGSCVETEEGTVSLAIGLEPLAFVSASSCSRVEGRSGSLEVSIAGFKTTLLGELRERAGLKVVVGDESISAISGSVIRVWSKRATLDFTHRFFNLRLKVLYPFTYQSVDLSRAVKANSAIIESPESSLTIASPKPMEIEFEPGVLRVSFESEALLARGGELQALALLLESMTIWRPVETTTGRLSLHSRLLRALTYLAAVEPPSLILAAYTLSGTGGAIELRVRRRLGEAYLIDPVSEESTRLRQLNGLLRVPLVAPYALISLTLRASTEKMLEESS